jgi:Rieske Fe-S protein
VDGLKLTELEINVPRQGVIRDVRRDAWTLHPNDVIGRVWVIKHGQARDALRVFTTICPHLGCSINANADPRTGFTCPCHAAEFTLAGAVVQRAGHTNPAPRGMDSLDFRIDQDNPEVLLVDYRNYRQGEHEKIAKG